jgi:hypothetical protein
VKAKRIGASKTTVHRWMKEAQATRQSIPIADLIVVDQKAADHIQNAIRDLDSIDIQAMTVSERIKRAKEKARAARWLADITGELVSKSESVKVDAKADAGEVFRDLLGRPPRSL